MSTSERANKVKRLAAECGFSRAGIARAEPVERRDYLRWWSASARPGTMEYLRRNSLLRENPAELIAGARSVIVVAQDYAAADSEKPADVPRGRVARYALGPDYHIVLKRRLKDFVSLLREELEEDFAARVCVDTVPILERELARAAGIGWIGKNTLVLNEDQGSYFFLGEVVTTLDLEPDAPATDHCGTCRRCLDACPTRAFPAPYEMDASRCISYLTIEHRTEIDPKLQPLMADWIFGCDVCQEVCPFNRDASSAHAAEPGPRTSEAFPVLNEIINWTECEYRTHVDGRAMDRATLQMFKRNARIAVTNHSHAPNERTKSATREGNSSDDREYSGS